MTAAERLSGTSVRPSILRSSFQHRTRDGTLRRPSVMLRLVTVAILVVVQLCAAQAQWSGNDSGLCPNGHWVYQGYAAMCVPNQSQPQQPQQPLCPAGSEYCAHVNLCCGSGNYCSTYGCIERGSVECGGWHCSPGQQCSRLQGRCLPSGKVDCGAYYCEQGQTCGSSHRACLASKDTDCGGYHCTDGQKCASGKRCIPQTATDCGAGKGYCSDGKKCSRDGKRCMAESDVDCGSFSCGSTNKCGSGNQCLAQNAVDCGGGKSCPVGNICVKGGAECLTKEQLAARVAEEKRVKADAALREREAADAKVWLAKEKARLEKERKTAEAAAAAASKKLDSAGKTCATDAEKIEAIARGKSLSHLPACKPSDGKQAGSPNGQPGSKNGVTGAKGGAVLNPDLEHSTTISSPAPAPGDKPPSGQSSPSAPKACSTFLPRDAALDEHGCPKQPVTQDARKPQADPPKPAPDVFGPGTPQQQRDAEIARKKAAEADEKAAQKARDLEPHEVVETSTSCSGPISGAQRLQCEGTGGGEPCRRTTTTRYCKKGLLGQNVDCGKSRTQVDYFCRK